METSLADSTIFAVWDKAREELLSTVGTKVFESWFAALELESFTDDSVTLSTDGAFAAIWVKENYIDVITRQITMAAGRNISVDIIAREESFTSADFSPKITFKSFSSGVVGASLFGVILPTKISPVFTCAPT